MVSPYQLGQSFVATVTIPGRSRANAPCTTEPTPKDGPCKDRKETKDARPGPGCGVGDGGKWCPIYIYGIHNGSACYQQEEDHTIRVINHYRVRGATQLRVIYRHEAETRRPWAFSTSSRCSSLPKASSFGRESLCISTYFHFSFCAKFVFE